MKKRICILLPSISDEGGGVTEAARALVQGLYDADEFLIEVLAFKSKLADDQLAMGRWPKVQIRLFSTYGPRAFCFSPAMMMYVARKSYDVVHMHGIWMAHGLAALIAQFKSIPTIISIHGMLDDWILARSKVKKLLVGFLFQNRLLKNASALHALTQSEIRDCERFSKGPVFLLPNFVDAPKHTNVPQWYIDDIFAKDVYLFLGRIHSKKRWHALLEAWIVLCNEDATFKDTSELIFCGWIDGETNFEERINEAALLCGNVRYIGPKYGVEKFETFSAADFFVLPSISEGMPMVVLEAASSDCILIISKECNLPEFFGGGAVETGTTPEAIKSALSIAKHMDSQRKQDMIKAARMTLNAQFERKSVLGRYIGLLKSL